MKEILGGNLKRFFDAIAPNYNDADITYAGEMYEVWKVSDELFEKMNNMSEEEFVELAGDDAFWRYSDGSVLGVTDAIYIVKEEELHAWDGCRRKEILRCKFCEEKEHIGCKMTENDMLDCYGERKYTSLLEYLYDEVGASQPKNVCALAMDLAKANNMSIGELFRKYEG